jgi:hypothetical protein
MSEQNLDPFALHLQLIEAGQASGLKDRFEAGEHRWLGTMGAELACAGDPAKLALLRALRRPKDKRVLTYGEIVALSGDFYGTAEELFLEKPSRFPWWKGSNDLAELRDAFDTELDWIRDEKRHRNAGYPDQTLTFVWTAKSYVELAEDNTAHFGWHNIKRYCESHTRAIVFALKAKTQDASDENWMRALFHNGFADHFLTDGFAAGHIRVPREQIREWAGGQGYSDKLAGLLSKVLHDQDGHVEGLHGQGEEPDSASEGLPVRNSRGERWNARCDGQMFLVPRPTTKAAPLIAEPVSAVAASLTEVFEAQQTKRAPEGEFAALKFVPFPDPTAPTLAEKFSDTSRERIEALLESSRWYTKLAALKLFTDASLDHDNIAALCRALPELMQSFRETVSAEYRASAELRVRLPRDYAEAFQQA